jgi:sortase A
VCRHPTDHGTPSADMKLRTRRAMILALAAFGVWQASAGLYIHAKAWLAQRLIASAWSSTLAGEREVKPWPWADTWPVGRLHHVATGSDLYVLADASGRSLAFGPGWLSGSAVPGTIGNSVIAAHRDTHFRFMRTVRLGDELLVETAQGGAQRYRVVEMRVIDTRTDRITFAADESLITLVTCYPFDAVVPGGPLRFIATARLEPPTQQHSISQQRI